MSVETTALALQRAVRDAEERELSQTPSVEVPVGTTGREVLGWRVTSTSLVERGSGEACA